MGFTGNMCDACKVKQPQAELEKLRGFANYMKDHIVLTSNAGWTLTNTCAPMIAKELEKLPKDSKD